MMKPISNKRGYILLDFIHLENEEAIDLKLHSPLIASLIVAEYQNQVLLVFDRYKQKWEVPGGHIEKNESPRKCSIRDLMEESGQAVSDLDFYGVAKISAGLLYYLCGGIFVPPYNGGCVSS